LGAVLDWVHQNLEEPETVFLNGGSAGGMAVAFYLPMLANHYPEARVVALWDVINAPAERLDATQKAMVALLHAARDKLASGLQ
jgi:carboxylesterase type B